jgi:hypothetical protein
MAVVCGRMPTPNLNGAPRFTSRCLLQRRSLYFGDMVFGWSSFRPFADVHEELLVDVGRANGVSGMGREADLVPT